MKWSVALFGHHKPRFELREKKQTQARLSKGTNYQGKEQFVTAMINRTVSRHVEMPVDFDDDLYFVYECTGWEQRAQPGDIITVMPTEHDARWTPTEQKEFLVITLDGDLTKDHIPGICESQWDTESYPVLPDPLSWDKIKEDRIELRPERYARKRRFSIPLNTLQSAGVDLEAMLDKGHVYAPKLRTFDKLECFDHLRKRHVVDADGLNLLKPKIIKRSDHGLL